MAASISPVNPAVLSWALAEDGRPVIELAERIGVALTDLEAWLGGDNHPTQGQLSKLADALGRSRATLLLPEPPVAATTPTAFRRAVGSGNETSARARKVVRESRQIQKALSWIRSGTMRSGGGRCRYSVPARGRMWRRCFADTPTRR